MRVPKSLPRPSVLTQGLLAGLLLAGSAFAKPPCPPDEVLPAVDLGNHSLAFADDGSGGFVGGGIAGTVTVRPSGVSVSTEGAGGAVGFDVAFPDGRLTPRAAPSSGGGSVVDLGAPDLPNHRRGTVQRIGADGRVTQLAAVERIVADGVYPGVDLEVESSQRRLDLSFRASSPEALSAVRLAFPSAGAVSTDGENRGRLRMEIPAKGKGGGGAFTLDLVALETLDGEERRLEAAFDVGDDGVAVHLLETPSSSDLRLLVTTLFGPYRGAAEVTRTADGGLVAVASRPSGGSLIAELDDSGLRVESTTLLGGDVEVKGVAATRDGRLLLAGSVPGERDSGIYLATLDTRRGTLQTSTALSTLTSGTAQDVEVTEDGRVLVTGLPGDNFPVIGRDRAEFNLVTPVHHELETRRLFVAELTPDLDRLVYAVDAVSPLRKVRVWVDCWGVIHIGTPFSVLGACDAEHTYSMGTSSSTLASCSVIDDGWGHGAMCWKASRVPTWGFHPSNVPASSFPNLIVQNPTDPGSGPADYKRLNQLEANQHGNLFYNNDDNQWDDPGGGWNHENNWAYSSEELAVAAALFHIRWDSPVFANFRLPDGSNPPAPRAVMLRAETFCADTEGELPHNACDEDADGDGVSDYGSDPWPSPPEYQVAQACIGAHGNEFELSTIDYDTWLGGAYVPNQTVDVADELQWWPWFTPYVGDPPGGDGEGDDKMTALHVQETASRLAAGARVRVQLQILTVTGGQIQVSAPFGARIPACALR
ncbi:MAG: hypothetical protein AAGD06_22820 [Acidobacteriota bacterium]